MKLRLIASAFISMAVVAVAVMPSTAVSALPKNTAKGRLVVSVDGSGTYSITGPGTSRTGSTTQTFRLKPGKYSVSAAGGTVHPQTVKIKKGKTARVAVSFTSNNGGGAGGVPVGEYTCYGAGTFSTFWIDSSSTYRTPSGTSGTYRLDTATTPYARGIKIDWLTGTYADWQKETPPYWSEYLPIGTIGTDGVPYTIPTILTTFNPGYTGVWTTCQLG